MTCCLVLIVNYLLLVKVKTIASTICCHCIIQLIR